MLRLVLCASLLTLAVLPVAAVAQSPCTLPVAAYLTDTDGAPLDGELEVELRFYTEDSAEALPAECRSTSASLDGGWLRFVVDACAPPDPDDCGVIPLQSIFDADDTVWIGFVIGGDELPPRHLVGTVPYAIRATRADDATNAVHADTADVASRLEGFEPTDYATVESLSPVATSGAFTDLTGVPEGLDDGDADTLGALPCAEGDMAVHDGVGWACGAPAGGGLTLVPITAPARSVVLIEPVGLDVLPVGLLADSPWGQTNTLAYDPMVGVGCDHCGAGTDGSVEFTASRIWPGNDQTEFHFDDFVIPAGVTITVDAMSPVVIRARRRIVIDGAIVVSGGDASDTTGGSGRAGGTAGASANVGPGSVGLGGCLASNNAGGAGAGGTGASGRSQRENDGGGGGHATAGTAGEGGGSPGSAGSATIDPTTPPETLTAGYGGGAGGTGWDSFGGSNRCAPGGGGGAGGGGLRLVTPHISVDGSVVADGGAGVCSGSPYSTAGGGGGSGGTIWIQAWRLDGEGSLSALGGAGGCGGGQGGDGVVFVETYDASSSTLGSDPIASTLEYSREPTGIIVSRTPEGLHLSNYRDVEFEGSVLIR